MPQPRPSRPEGELICLLKLLQYLFVATVIGSVISIAVALVIDSLMR
jgi:hypothetical protein